MPAATRRTWTADEITAAIRAWADAHGTPPTMSAWTVAAPEHPNQRVVTGRFGNWTSALVAAGFDPVRGRRARAAPAPDRPPDLAPAVAAIAARVRAVAAAHRTCDPDDVAAELDLLAEEAAWWATRIRSPGYVPDPPGNACAI